MKTTTISKTSGIARIYVLIIFSLFALLASAQKSSVSNGNWNTDTTWLPSGVPGANNLVDVNHQVLLDKNLTGGNGITGTISISAEKSLVQTGSYNLEIKNGGTLVIAGTLEVNNLTFANGSNVNITSSGAVIVRGSFSNNNNSNNVTVNGTLTLYGSAYNGTGGVISGIGSINALGGAFTGDGSISGSISLPVELLSFSATGRNNRVEIEWITASEVNNHFFTVEKSFDGVTFSTAGTVNGAGNSSYKNEYRFSDESGSEVTYYRLKQTDYNGHFTYCSNIIAYKDQSGTEWTVYPNPVIDSNVYVQMINGSESNTEVQLLDMSGKAIYKFKGAESNSMITIPQIVLSEGTYILSIKTGNTVVAKKLVVK